MPRIGSKAIGIEFFIGIDPGEGGGITVLRGPMKIYKSIEMPESERDIWEFIREFNSENSVGLIERVWSGKGQGVASMFTFGMSYGKLRMALIAAGIPFEEETPVTWMKGLGIPTGGKKQEYKERKEKLRAKAQQMFPSFPLWSQPKTLTKQRAVCDSMLLAARCQRKYLGVS